MKAVTVADDLIGLGASTWQLKRSNLFSWTQRRKRMWICWNKRQACPLTLQRQIRYRPPLSWFPHVFGLLGFLLFY